MGIIQERCKVVTWEDATSRGGKKVGHLIHGKHFIVGLVTLIRLIKVHFNSIMFVNKIWQ